MYGFCGVGHGIAVTAVTKAASHATWEHSLEPESSGRITWGANICFCAVLVLVVPTWKGSLLEKVDQNVDYESMTDHYSCSIQRRTAAF